MEYTPRQALTILVRQYGEQVTTDPNKIQAFLKDYCGENKLEINVLVASVKNHVPEFILSQKNLPFSLLENQLIAQLKTQHGLSDKNARWVIETWGVALSLLSETKCKTPDLISSGPYSTLNVSSQKVDRKIDAWKQDLYDFSKRNPLLYYKPTQSSTLEILSPKMDWVYERIVNRGEKLAFPQYRTEFVAAPTDVGQARRYVTRYVLEHKGDLSADKTEGTLIRSLNNIRNSARSSRNELGLNSLFMAFGLLRWSDSSNPGQLNSSPLILVPADIERVEGKDKYLLSYFDEDILLNPTLAAFLVDPRFNYNLKLPDLADDQDLDLKSYLQEVENLVALRGWFVDNSVVIKLFSFQTIRLGRDLDDGRAMGLYPPIIRMLSGDTLPASPASNQPVDLDSDLKPEDFLQVLDADATQANALVMSRSGKHMVIQGPPGTGKSQTIVNLIAQTIADHKTVLFVSQKKAALDVVFRRLTQVGLDKLCLQVHSEKANKKAVLNELQEVYLYQRNDGITSTAHDYELLYRYRNQLNEIVQHLNQPTGRLGLTVQEVMGELLQMENVPSIRSQFEGYQKNYLEWSQAEWNQIVQTAQEFTRTYLQLGCKPEVHSWRFLNIQKLGVSAISDIQLSLEDLLDVEPDLLSLGDEIEQWFHLTLVTTLQELLWAVDVVKFITTSPLLLKSWFADIDIAGLLGEIEEGQKNAEVVIRLKEFLRQENIRFALLDQKMEDENAALNHALKVQESYLKDVNSYSARLKRTEVLQNLRDIIAKFKKHWEFVLKLRSILQVEAIVRVDTITWAAQLMNIASLLDHPMACWFNGNDLISIKKQVTQAAQTSESLKSIKSKILSSWTDEILGITNTKFIEKVQREFANPIKRLISKEYRILFKSMVKFWKGEKKLKYQDLVELSQDLQNYIILNSWFENSDSYFLLNLGERYLREGTNFAELQEQLGLVRKLVSCFNGLPVPEGLTTKLASSFLSQKEWANLRDEALLVAQSAVECHQTLTPLLQPALLVDIGDENSLYIDRSLDIAIKAEKSLANLGATLDNFYSFTNVDDLPFENINEIYNVCKEIQLHEGMIRRKENDYKENFGDYYNGLETNWNDLKHAVESAGKLIAFLKKGDPKNGMIPAGTDLTAFISLLESFETVRKSAQRLYPNFFSRCRDFETRVKRLESYFLSFNAAFPTNDFSSIPFSEIFQWASKLHEQTDEIPAWLEYSSALEEVEKSGLARIVEEVAAKDEPAVEQFAAIVRKRYLQLWLDEAYMLYKDIRTLNIGQHERRVEDFINLDRKLMDLQSKKVLQTWQNSLPALFNTTPDSQAGILAREFNKKRAHAPLRRLFAKTPDLLLKLKPCVLMSPLSVAAYLPLEQFRERFDMVIFDEASQVKPAFAVGAMLRAKQVIVAGDLMQLPPTDFFHVTADLEIENEEDEEGDDVPLGQLESILGEFDSLSGIQKSRLLWHYRSRHEALIHFSNQTYYGGSLITFPSPLTSSHKVAIHYQYVQGIYDRGKSRQNQIEASKVVELIADHLRTFKGGRSLGIITLSIAQENAIRDQLYYEISRGLNRDLLAYRELLNEDAPVEEPFFIKSLERVQGDERDCIILSIGYGPDSSGKITQTFGPVNLAGGERRLNVAVTRAKHQITLVSSIRAEDIRLTENSKPGLRDLRNYLVYCQRLQTPALSKSDVTSNQYRPFEDEVFKTLREWGYTVDRNLGMSGFHIDLAIRHPEHPERYLVGIICDGKNYASGIIARDRERLRPQILKNMNWKLIRLWAKEWMLKPAQSRQALRDLIEEAGKETIESEERGESKGNPDPVHFTVISTATSGTHFDQANGNGAAISPDLNEDWKRKIKMVKYSIYQPSRHFPSYQYGRDPQGMDLMVEIVSQEQPIHEDILYDRFRLCYGLDGTSKYQKQLFQRLLMSAIQTKKLVQKNAFIQLPTNNFHVIPRYPASGETPRRIEHISLEEIKELLKQITTHVYGVSTSALIKEAATLLGYQNASSTRKERIEAALNEMVKQGIVRLSGDSVVPATTRSGE